MRQEKGMFTSAALLACALAVAPVQSKAPLAPGDQAPTLKVAEWVKGEPFAGYDKSGFTVVEFWATWCQYSFEAVPQMSELASKYKGRVPFVAVSVWEQGDVAKMVQTYVKDMGDKMNYTVARDTPDELMAQAWMETTESDLPTAFLINRKGTIVWIGHPAELAKIMDDALMNRLDPAKVRGDFLAARAVRSQEKAFLAKLDGIKQAYLKGGRVEALAALDELKPPLPYLEGEKANNKLGMLAYHDMAKAEAYALELANAPQNQAMALAQWVFYIPNGTVGRETIYSPLMQKTYTMVASKHGAKNPTLHIMAAYSFFQLNDKVSAKKAAEAGLVELPNSDLKDNEELKKAFDELIKKSS